jgi:hypothetical protein
MQDSWLNGDREQNVPRPYPNENTLVHYDTQVLRDESEDLEHRKSKETNTQARTILRW